MSKNLRILTALAAAMVITNMAFGADAQQEGERAPSRYMGGAVQLVTAPNGAIVNAEALQASRRILYLEPTTEKVADGVWCIGGYSLANTTVIEGDDGLIVYDTGDTREEAEHKG